MWNTPAGCDCSDAPWNRDDSYEDSKAYSIALDEIKTIADEYREWVADKYESDVNDLPYDEFLVFCEKIAEDNDVVNEYYEYRRDDIVCSIDWEDDGGFDG